jgi:hypothetical protein
MSGKQLRLPIAVHELRRTRDPLPEPLVRQLLRRRSTPIAVRHPETPR